MTPKDSAAQRRVWRGVPAVHATVYRDDDGNEIIGSRGEWMLLAGESVCGPFRTLTKAKQYVELDDLYPGTGAVSKAWESWATQLRLAV